MCWLPCRELGSLQRHLWFQSADHCAQCSQITNELICYHGYWDIKMVFPSRLRVEVAGAPAGWLQISAKIPESALEFSIFYFYHFKFSWQRQNDRAVQPANPYFINELLCSLIKEKVLILILLDQWETIETTKHFVSSSLHCLHPPGTSALPECAKTRLFLTSTEYFWLSNIHPVRQYISIGTAHIFVSTLFY